MIKITGLWENKDKNGNTYYSGTMGSSKVIIMKNTFKKEGSNQPDWNFCIAENKKKSDNKEAVESKQEQVDVTNDQDVPF